MVNISMTRIIIAFVMMILSSSSFASEWKLVWSDEFNYVGKPDEAKWGYEQGFNRNKELQYYTNQNAKVENGSLIIEARKELVKNPAYKPNSTSWRENREVAKYTSSSLMTLNKASFTYGRIEVRAKLAYGKGVWTAIWMLGENITNVGYPKCGEIDILEYFGKIPNKIFANIHYEDHGKRASKNGKIEIINPFDDFHVYAIEWFTDRIDFYIDNTQYMSFSVDNAGLESENPFRKPQYILINLALGGKSGGDVDDNILPQKYLIDYVRVYQHK